MENQPFTATLKFACETRELIRNDRKIKWLIEAVYVEVVINGGM